MKRPPYGLSLPCRLVALRDGDTAEIELASGFVYAIRLIDCWCPETRGQEKERGLAAKRRAQELCDKAKQLAVFIPAPDLRRGMNPLQFLTFDRIPGYLYLSEKHTLNEILVREGHATKEKSR